MIGFLLSIALSFVLVGALIPVLRRAQFMDVPNHRSSHASPTPRGGGLAVMATIPIALAATDGFAAWTLVVLALLLSMIGLADDLRPLSARLRLLAQGASAIAVWVWLIASDVGEEWWLLAVTIPVIVAFVNAFNFMDGVNGISALTTTVVGVFWAATGGQLDLGSVQILGLVLAGGALGFLPWNAPRARVFLGDVGSYGLGLLIGGLSVLAWAQGAHWLVAAAPLVVYGADTGWVLVKRARAGRPMTEAHREHVYQRMVDAGWPHLGAAALCAAAVGIMCITAWLTWQSAPMLGLFLVVVLAIAYLAAPRLLTAGGTAS